MSVANQKDAEYSLSVSSYFTKIEVQNVGKAFDHIPDFTASSFFLYQPENNLANTYLLEETNNNLNQAYLVYILNASLTGAFSILKSILIPTRLLIFTKSNSFLQSTQYANKK